MLRPRRLAGALAALLALAIVGTAAPAQAAVPDKFGFVLWTGSVVPTSTWPAATTVTVFPPNVVQVRFPGIAAPGGVVHATAVIGGPRWCQALKWFPAGADEIVYIACYGIGGAPALTPFSAIFDSSSGPPAAVSGSFGYADVAAGGALISQFNSAGAVNAAGVLAPGVIEVKLPGLSTPGPMDGSIQVTAVNGAPARCKIGSWKSSPAGQDVLVLCFDGAGAPIATEFTITFQYQRSLFGGAFPPKYFGYLWNKPLGGPPSTNFNSALGPAANGVFVSGPGFYVVTFPMIAGVPDDLQVTATGYGSDFCNLIEPWMNASGTILARVVCYTTGGARDPSAGFTISASSAI